jgi:uncharacterized integral membrane protein
MGDSCEGCQGKAVTIVVKRSVFGLAMYVADIIAAILIVLYVANRDFHAGFASFMADINNDLFLVVLFGIIIGSFVLAFLDLGRTNREARRIVDERKGRWHD